jgi:hypothetical protein
VSELESCSGTFVVKSTIAKVLVAPVGAAMISFGTVNADPGVAESIVTVLVFALVIRINPKLELGAWPLDQLVPIRHRPLTAFVQSFVFAPNILKTPIGITPSNKAQGRKQNFISARRA